MCMIMNCSCFRSDLIHRLQLPIFSLIYSSVQPQPSFQPVITLHSLSSLFLNQFPLYIPSFYFQPPREDKKTSLHPVITGFRCFHISSVFRRTHSATVYSYLKSHFVSNRRGYKCSRIKSWMSRGKKESCEVIKRCSYRQADHFPAWRQQISGLDLTGNNTGKQAPKN